MATKKEAAVQERLNELNDEYTSGILEVFNDPEKYRNWLKSQLRLKCGMKDYSATNKLLILRQRPDATYVQSYRAWKEMGFPVKEKGAIYIFAPVMARYVLSSAFPGGKKSWSACTKEEKAWAKDKTRSDYVLTERCIGNKPTHVFDISNTTATEEDMVKLLPQEHDCPMDAEVAYQHLSDALGMESDETTPELRLFELIQAYVSDKLSGSCEKTYQQILNDGVSYAVFNFFGFSDAVVDYRTMAGNSWTDDDIENLTRLNKLLCTESRHFVEELCSLI